MNTDINIEDVFEPRDSVFRTQLVTRKFSDIEAQQVRFVWPNRIPSKLSVIAGNPGCGKSQLTIALAAIISTGGMWPDSEPCKRGSVIFIANEDDAADTIKPRLEAAGADCDRVYIVDGITSITGGLSGWTLEKGIDEITGMCDELGDVAMIVIDPITAYVGGKDGHSTTDIRGLLAPLMELADAREIAIVAISHLNKNSGGEAMTRVTGSLAYVAAARAAFVVGQHPDIEDAYCMATLKANLSAVKTGIGYRVVGVTTENGIGTSKVEWIPGIVNIDADDLLMNKQRSNDLVTQTAISEAAEFLVDLLECGPIRSKQVFIDAKVLGISASAVKRAKKDMKIESKRVSDVWYMSLPLVSEEDQSVSP